MLESSNVLNDGLSLMMIVYLDNTPFPINLEKVIAFLIP